MDTDAEEAWINDLATEIETEIDKSSNMKNNKTSASPTNVSRFQNCMPLEILLRVYEFSPFGLEICESWMTAAVFGKN